MTKNLFASLALAAVLSVSAAGAYAAEATAPMAAPAKAVHAVKLSKDEVKKIHTECKGENKTDKTAYKACVTAKEKAAQAGEVAPAAAPATTN